MAAGILRLEMREFELKVLHFVTCDLDSPTTDWIVTWVCDWRIAACLGAIVLLALVASPPRRPRVGRMLVALALAGAAAGAAKWALWTFAPRDRPERSFVREGAPVQPDILIGPIQRATCAQQPEKWVEHDYGPRSPSFPSSHTIFAAVVAGVLGFAFPRLAAPAWLYALLIGVWRLWAGKHWPSDVVGSLLLGALLSWLSWRVSPRLQALAATWVSRRRAGLPAAPG